MMRIIRIVPTLWLCACNWISLGANALTYDTLAAGEAGNVVVLDSVAYVSLGDSGLAIVRVLDGSRVALVPPAPGTGSVDDLAIADGKLFTLDARSPGRLSVHSLAHPLRPTLLGTRPVPVEPFSGVSAGGGLCIVSGGTSQLTAWRFDSTGELSFADSLDLGRGQPDVLVDRAGRRAWISTHYWGPYFGIDVVSFSPEGRLSRTGTLEIDGAGFTAGGAKPSNFPVSSAALDDSTLLVAHARGLAVIDAGHADSLRLLRVIDVGGPATHVDVLGRDVAVTVAGRTPGAVVLDFQTNEPRIVRRVTFAPGTKPVGVALSTRNLLVAARDRGVLVVQR